jgi:hypothetical protein
VLRAGLTGSGKWPTRLQVLPDILAVTVYAIAPPMNSFPKEAVNRALLKVGPAAAWRMSCRRSVGGRGHGRVISCRVHLDAAHESLMIAQGLHEKARPAEKTVPGISNLMNAKLVSGSTWASPRRDGEG